jgi:hypothetical protein
LRSNGTILPCAIALQKRTDVGHWEPIIDGNTLITEKEKLIARVGAWLDSCCNCTARLSQHSIAVFDHEEHAGLRWHSQ